MAEKQQQFTAEEISKIAPNYRGRPENFNPRKASGDKAGKKPMGKARSTSARMGPSSPKLPEPEHLAKNATPTVQKNDLLYLDSIFGLDVQVAEIAPMQTFSPNISRMVNISDEVYNQMSIDDQMLGRNLAQPEMAYYCGALLWGRLIDLKARSGRVTLSSIEKDFRKATEFDVFNVPQPVFMYLSAIGDAVDRGGKRTELASHDLPVAVAAGLGGYHAPVINGNNHNLFEELPCLGVLGDVVMACASQNDIPNVATQVAAPNGMVVNGNLSGFKPQIGPRRMEIRQKLHSYNITEQGFEETIAGTRFNLRYVRAISAILGQTKTFRMEQVCLSKLGTDGHVPMIIQTIPDNDIDRGINWRARSVQAEAPEAESTAVMGAAIFYGFQLHKLTPPGSGETESTRRSTWACVSKAVGDNGVDVPDLWDNNKNARRALPAGIATTRFRSIVLNQDVETSNIVQRMVRASR